VNFCRALLKELDILYLDEPTSGLDPATTDKIHELIQEERRNETTIFLTTHNMHEAEKLCDKIILLNEGSIIEQGVPRDICMKYNIENTIEILLKNQKKYVLQNNSASSDTLYKMMKEETIVSIHSSEPDLEKIFLHLTGRKLNE
jgi:ABC-2 type transport system ATP-binding protein